EKLKVIGKFLSSLNPSGESKDDTCHSFTSYNPENIPKMLTVPATSALYLFYSFFDYFGK
ncbi:hypothetical protein, partial [Bacteroides uniformis]|uniref:hypothetical protein n=1 Tax=Bacteroides uniformis TaxID=820 RepID=UPI001AA175B0